MAADLTSWSELAKAGVGFAMSRLSRLAGLGVECSFALVSPNEMAGPIACPGREAAGVRLAVTGAGSGWMLIVLDLESARGFVDLLIGREPREEHAAAADRLTVLAELGGALGAAVVGALTVGTGLAFAVSEPCVQIDRPDVMLRYIVAGSQCEAGGATVAQATFSAGGGGLWGTMYFVPSANLREILRHARRAA